VVAEPAGAASSPNVVAASATIPVNTPTRLPIDLIIRGNLTLNAREPDPRGARLRTAHPPGGGGERRRSARYSDVGMWMSEGGAEPTLNPGAVPSRLEGIGE